MRVTPVPELLPPDGTRWCVGGCREELSLELEEEGCSGTDGASGGLPLSATVGGLSLPAGAGDVTELAAATAASLCLFLSCASASCLSSAGLKVTA